MPARTALFSLKKYPLIVVCLAFILAACSGGGGGTTSTPTYTISGTVSGLSGSLVLQDNGGDDLTISANGSFTFATPLASGASYVVTQFSQQFPNQTCTITNDQNTVGGNVSNVAVDCVKYTSPRYAYTANGGDNSVSTYVVDSASGRLKYIGKVAAGTNPNSVTVDPSGRYAYVANYGGNVSQYSIAADGSLSPLATPAVAAGTNPYSVVIAGTWQ